VKFLLDVPVGREIAEWLRKQGYDAAEARTIDPTLSDLGILRLARAQHRIVITTGVAKHANQKSSRGS
jgi:uncharacterized protein with PIN domain